MNYDDFYYIGSGRDNKMYTLRHVFYEDVYRKDALGRAFSCGKAQRDHYIRNLSTNYDDALQKAQVYINSLINPAKLQTQEFKLEDIVRREKEELDRLREEQRRKEAEEKAHLRRRTEEIQSKGKKAIMPFGKHMGKEIHEIPTDYKMWFINTIDETSEPEAVALANIMKGSDDVLCALEQNETVKDIILEEVRQEIVGKLLSMQSFESYYGTQLKMLVLREDGYKFFGTVPRALYDAEINDTVKFNALPTVKEPGFAYFKKPTKAEIVK